MQQVVSAVGAGAAPPPPPPVVGVVGLKLRYPILPGLLAAYLDAALPESLYELNLDGGEKVKLATDCMRITEGWVGG